MLLGCQLSIARGIEKSIDKAQKLGINALQIFSHNPRSWTMRPLKEGEDKIFIRKREESDIQYVVIHTSYLINLASPLDDLYRKSIKILKQEIRRADQLKVKNVVTHIGAHRGQGLKSGIKRVAKALKKLKKYLDETKTGVKLLLENTAACGTTVGSDFNQIGNILKLAQLEEKSVGVCLDTAHGLSSSYDLVTKEGIEETLRQLNDQIGHSRLELIHLNDSKYKMGSRKDGHEHIGKGHIGPKGFKNLINHPKLMHLPFILETPKTFSDGSDADRTNLDRVLKLWAKSKVQKL